MKLFSIDKQIKDVIEQILEEIQSKSVNFNSQASTNIFILKSNKNVQRKCAINELVPKK